MYEIEKSEKCQAAAEHVRNRKKWKNAKLRLNMYEIEKSKKC